MVTIKWPLHAELICSLTLSYLSYLIHCCHGNQFVRESWAKNHDLREEKWHFLKISNRYCVFELRFEIRSLKLLLKFKLNLSKNKETMKTFHFFSCRDIKMTILTSYF